MLLQDEAEGQTGSAAANDETADRARAGAGDADPRPSRPPAETTVSSPGVDGLSMRRLSDAPGRDRVMLYRHVATRPQFIST